MADVQKVDDAHFRAFKNSIEESSAAFSANLRTLVNAIDNVAGRWEGEAALAFKQAQRELNADHDAVRRLIDEFSLAVTETHKNSKANDADIAASMKRAHAAAGSTSAISGL
ncbi:WXG100 family type VII secretion target [Streptomyces sp. SCA3-4]|uniref:WXG100 family type VII secretion target n=1 Tax=Streptomyces sichuanensis TaxID=2871810 RepID=UPI001CE2378E|nr:WXG100 family type VII secretion target [Streptomyces sichuanensis]MCA6095888.1 WXG100 family type VII secretion target [Streptomyces sichuanensis]